MLDTYFKISERGSTVGREVRGGLVTYTLQTESGASLRGAGWKVVAELAPNKPSMWQTRPGREWQPVVGQAKLRWEAE